MKNICTLVAFLVSIALSSHGQSVIRSNVGSSGSSHTVVSQNKTYFVSQSIGQASVIGTSSSKGYTIRQGFQQPPSSIFAVGSVVSNDFLATIYPNPFTQTIRISFEEEVENEVTVIMRDISGRIVSAQYFAPSRSIEMSLHEMASGSYIINVLVGQNRFTTSIIKL